MCRIILTAIALAIIVVAGCAPFKTTYIEILEPDRAFYGGKLSFEAEPGDILELISSNICGSDGERMSMKAIRSGYANKTCWEVWHIEKKKRGYVRKDRMEERHRIYQKEE